MWLSSCQTHRGIAEEDLPVDTQPCVPVAVATHAITTPAQSSTSEVVAHGKLPANANPVFAKMYTAIMGKHARMRFECTELADGNWLIKCKNMSSIFPHPIEDSNMAAVDADPYVSWLCGNITLTPVIYGRRAWSKYLGDVGEVPPLPDDIVTILTEACPFWEGKRVHETHLLTLIPATVDGKPLTLNLLRDLVQSPKNDGNKTKLFTKDSSVRDRFGEDSFEESRWVLLTRDVLPGSLPQGYDDQKAVLARHASKGYEEPELLGTATSLLMHYICSGEWLYGNKPVTYTRCRDEMMFDERPYPTLVGRFTDAGLDFDYDLTCYVFNLDGYGMAGSREL